MVRQFEAGLAIEAVVILLYKLPRTRKSCDKKKEMQPKVIVHGQEQLGQERGQSSRLPTAGVHFFSL